MGAGYAAFGAGMGVLCGSMAPRPRMFEGSCEGNMSFCVSVSPRGCFKGTIRFSLRALYCKGFSLHFLKTS